MVACSDAVDRQHCGCCSRQSEKRRNGHAICASPGCELVWSARGFNVFAELLREGFGNQRPESRAGGNPAHATVWLLEGRHRCCHERFSDCHWD